MAGFRTHIATSSLLGIGYASGCSVAGVPFSTSVLAGGLCSLAGMMPDLDSDTGIPLRESTAFVAAIVPMLLIDRFEYMGWSHETIILAGSGIYLSLRFGLHRFLRGYTVHRGMFHSLPAAVIVGQLVLLLCSANDLTARLVKAGGAVLGYCSHLILDEVASISWRYGVPRLKKSFGTATKVWGRSLSGNISVYAKLVLLALLLSNDPMLREQWQRHFDRLDRVATERFDGWLRRRSPLRNETNVEIPNEPGSRPFLPLSSVPAEEPRVRVSRKDTPEGPPSGDARSPDAWRTQLR